MRWLAILKQEIASQGRADDICQCTSVQEWKASWLLRHLSMNFTTSLCALGPVKI
jgi:hypothetical protein